MSGRAADARLVHFELPEGVAAPRPGDMVTTRITAAAPYHLLADLAPDSNFSIRRTRAGDAWDAAQAASCAVPSTSADGEKPSVSLGLPLMLKPKKS